MNNEKRRWLERREDWPVIILRGGTGWITLDTLGSTPTTREIFILHKRMGIQQNIAREEFSRQLGLNHCSVLYQEYCCLDLTDLYLLLFVLCFAHNKWARWQEHGVSLTRPDCINITISSHSLTTVNVNTCSTSSVVSTRRGEGEGVVDCSILVLAFFDAWYNDTSTMIYIEIHIFRCSSFMLLFFIFDIFVFR